MNERGRKKVTCEQCGKSFVSFEDLTLHQSTEKGHITPNYLSKPTSVEVRTVHQSCIRLNWSPPMGIAVHQYYIQSYNPGKQEWSSLGVVHPQMPSFIINSDMLSDLCKPVAEIGICAVNVQQQCGPRYVVQFQKIPIQVNGMGVLEYKLEKTHWQKLDWKIHHSAPYQLKNLKTSGPVGTPEKLAARQTANEDILLSWCEPGVNRDEDQDLAISSHGNFTGYSIFISKVNSDTWACVKNLNEEVYSTVIPHENIPELSEYQVGIKAKKGFHTGPMAILCFHHMKPDGSVFVNELEPCKTCNALKTKSVRSFVTKGTGINRMEVDSDDDLQVDEDVFCLEKSSKTDVFQTANHDLKRAMGRKAVFFFANHFYQPVTELPISISNVHSDGCGKIRLKVSISQDLWRTLNTTLDDQGKPLYHVFLRMGRHYGDKFEDEIPECLISVNKRIVKVQVANGLSPCKDGPVDITGSLHPNNNNIILTIKPGCEQPYMVYIHMVRKLGPKATVRRLLKERVIPQSRTKRLIKNYLTADRNSIKYCSYKVKLTCPITQGRLETPCRGDRCKHIQCMEAGTVIQMNETKKGRRCLLCKEPYNKLDIDGLFLEILQSVPSSVTEVEFNPEGEWKTVLNTDESGPSVSIDDDVVMPQLAEVLNDHTEVDSECEAIAGFHKDVQGKTDDVPQVKIENVEDESWSTENGGWYLSQYGLELKDNDVELVDAEVRQDIGMQFATESNVNHCADQTDGMICDNNSPNLKVEDFSYSKDDNEAEDMSIQNIDIFPHKKGSAQDTSTSQIMIEDQESGKRVYLYENILSEVGDEFLSCESELEKRTSESLEGDHNVNDYDALGLAFNFTQATSSSQNSNVEETVTMDTSWNGREIIEVDKDLCTTEDMSLSDDLKEPSDSSQEDVQIQKGLTPCSTLIQGQKRIITTPAGKKKRITSRYIINSKIYLDEEITCKIFTCSECKMEYSYARMFEGAEQKMCLDCALEHNFLSKDLFTVLNTGNISLQPSYSHSRKFWCTKCRHKYGLSMLYKVNDLNMFCKNCALELNYISQGTGDQLSSIKLCSCSKCKKQQEDKEIAAENSCMKHKKQHKDKEIAAENSCLKRKKQHKDKEIAAENSCLKHKKQHKDKEIAAENSRLKHKKQHKDKDIAAENQTKLNQSKQNINVIKKLPIDEEQMVEENNDLTKKCYLPMCPAPRQCSNYNQAGICMKDNLTSRKIAFTNFVKKKIAAKMKQKGVALDESNHSKESELSHVDDPQHPDLGNSAKDTSKVCVICHTNQDGNNVVWYQNDSQQICPLCFQKKLVEKCIEANQKRRKIAATDFKRKKSAAKMKQKGVKLDVSNHCKKRGSSLVDTKQHPDLGNSAKDTSKVCFICHINQDGKKTVVWHQIDSKPICFLCFKKKMVEKGKKEKLTRKKIAFTNFVKKKLAAKMKQKGVTLDESNHCIESDSSHVDTPQHLDLGNSAKDTSNVCVICHTNQDGNKAAVRHQIDSQPICSWCFKKKQEEKGSTYKETPYVAENHCRNYQKDKDLEKDCNDEVCKNTSSKKTGKYSPFDSKVNNLKALNKDRQNNALKHCHSDESIVCILDSSTASPTYAIDMAYDINEPELNSDNYIEVLECDAGEFDNEGDGSNDHRNVQTNENSAIKHILQKKGSERDIEVTDNDDKGFDFFKHLRSYGIAKDKKTPFDPRTSNQSKNINSLKNQGLPEEMKGANPFCDTEAHTKQEMITEVLVCTHCSLRDQAGCVHHWYNVGGNFYCSDCFSLFQSALQDNHVSERNTTKFCLFIRFKKLNNSSIFDVEGVEFTAQFEELAKHEQKGEIDNTSVEDTETSPNKSNSLSMRCLLDYKGCCRSMKCSSLCQHFREWRCGQVPLSFISDCHVSLCRIDGVCKRCKVRHIKISALDNQGVNKRKLRGKESQNETGRL